MILPNNAWTMNMPSWFALQQQLCVGRDHLPWQDVFLIDGLITERFIAKNPVISRTIEIKGSNTLEDLHKIIFKAFDRKDEHMYEFQVGGCGPQDPNARRYGLKQAFSSSDFTEAPTGEVSSTPIASLGLSIDDAFGYWFDFGDNWWH